jgi:ABC-type Na+ efflux pump permease subunit
MRNTWLIIQREYLERVRQRSFLVLTLLLPAIIVGAFVIPSKLSRMKNSKTQRLVVVTSTPQFGEIVRQQLVAKTKIKKKTSTTTTNPAATMRSRWIRIPAKRSGQPCGIG